MKTASGVITIINATTAAAAATIIIFSPFRKRATRSTSVVAPLPMDVCVVVLVAIIVDKKKLRANKMKDKTLGCC